MSAPGAGLTLHAGCVAWDGRGLLILGKSGSGKSALALQLMAWGAELVADDRTRLCRRGPALVASAPPRGRGLIEARGVGLLRAPARAEAPVVLAVDLDRAETDRLPPRRGVPLLGVEIPLILNAASPHFAAAVLQCLKSGRHA